LYDVFEIRTPYTIPPRSIRQNTQKDNIKTTTLPANTTTHPSAITKAFDLTSTKQAYAPNYKQACMFLRAIQINRRERLSPECLRHLSTFVVQSWEVDPTEAKVTELIDVMNHLVDTTQIDTTINLDEALRQSCRNPAALPTVCPIVALLVAMRYIDRLKKKYNNIRGAMGCSHRLIVVAYMMAIKFIHANLRLIIDVTEEQEQKEEEEEEERQRRSSLDAHIYSRLSTERSTLKKSPSPMVSSMVSPPASPKSQCSQPEKNQQQQQQQENDVSKNQRALQALRMEIEFLHFLNYDLTVSDPVGLVEWAHRPATKAQQQQQQQQIVDEPSPASTTTYYSSENEGDDELEADDTLSLG
ncbi:hypothetical protein INT45_004477, partial [Circinella minor]